MLERIALAAAIAVTAAPAPAFWDGIDRLAVLAVSGLNGDETLLFREIHVHNFERGGDETRAVCGEVWFDGTSDYVRFVQLFRRFGSQPEPIGLPLITDRTQSPLRLDTLWASFCRDVPRIPAEEMIAVMAD
jgi:hypothetical protein